MFHKVYYSLTIFLKKLQQIKTMEAEWLSHPIRVKMVRDSNTSVQMTMSTDVVQLACGWMVAISDQVKRKNIHRVNELVGWLD